MLTEPDCGQATALDYAVSSIAESIRESSADFYVIATHYDADGLAAASIIARTLFKMERPFIIRVMDQADEDSLDRLPKGDYYIFSDLGSIAINIIMKKDLKPTIILDHHEPLESREHEPGVLELNPHRVGVNGAKEISASGLAYLVAKKVGVDDHMTAYLALVGAIGDRQESASQGLISINKVILDDAINRGWVKKTIGLRLYGVPRQPLVKSLMYTIDPLLPGLTYDEIACQRFLELVGIPLRKPDGSMMTYKDLRSEDVSRLATALIKHLLAKGLNPKTADSLFGYMYEFLLEPEGSPLRYAHEYAQTLNACGRLRRHGVGLAIALGDRDKALSQAEAISLEYRRRLSQYISLLRSDTSYIKMLNNIQLMNLSGIVDDRILGALSSIVLSSYLCDISRPLISITSTSQGRIKVSARMHESLLKKGVNLGLLVRQAAEEVKGSGGGHDVAAGAVIPTQALDRFIKLIDSLVGKSLKWG